MISNVNQLHLNSIQASNFLDIVTQGKGDKVINKTIDETNRLSLKKHPT